MHARGGRDHSQPAATPASAAGWTEVGPSMRCDGAVCGADSQLAPCAPSGAAQSVVVASAAPAPSARGRVETPTHSRDPSRSGRARRPGPRRASGRRRCRRHSTPAPPARPRSRPPWPRPRPGPAAPPRPGRGLRKGVSARTTRCPRTEEHVDHDRPRVLARARKGAAEAKDLAGKQPPDQSDGVLALCACVSVGHGSGEPHCCCKESRRRRTASARRCRKAR